MAGEVVADGLRAVQAMYKEELREALRSRSFANLIVLNEWRRRFGVKDPVGFHAKVWQTELVCPAGGKYVWNEEQQTMESTAVGHPGAPKAVADVPDPLGHVEAISAGMTFEDDGLRARVTIQTTK